MVTVVESIPNVDGVIYIKWNLLKKNYNFQKFQFSKNEKYNKIKSEVMNKKFDLR